MASSCARLVELAWYIAGVRYSMYPSTRDLSRVMVALIGKFLLVRRIALNFQLAWELNVEIAAEIIRMDWVLYFVK